MRQDKERSIREQADLWKGYWCILACILLVGRVSYLTFFQNHIVSVYAAAQTEQKEDSSVQILQENLMEEIQIDDVQKMLDEIMDDHVFSVREALMNIINGEDPVSKETVRSFLYSLFFSDIENEKGLILKLLLVIFIAAVLAEFADVFGNGQAGSISFYIVYLAYGEFLKAWKYAYKLASWTDGFHESSVSGLFYDSGCINRIINSCCIL